ncbi:Protein RALF-like 34 [Stylosanthes scabra]|uniref:Protein RALF-like 34 n=1 Tax=Stylosanthes scabra TaxID=79078 RepID=A0ABU6VAH6_9FABA|nr:Protein RALF-like 34 [Stylosanthes scabra]
MATSLPLLKVVVLVVFSVLLLCLTLSPNALAVAQIDETSLNLMSDALEWPTAAMSSIYDADVDEESEEEDVEGGRRSLFWRRMKYYISYGALSANRIPCPPRSGRSYYTHNCFKARGPAHPYSRGCSVITRCRR